MKKRLLSLLLAMIMVVTLMPTAAFATASNDYTQWKQYDSEWNQSEAWPASQYPNATYRWMRQAGCYVTTIAILLRHYNVVTDSDVNNFNPWICNTELGKVGALNSAADLIAGNISKAYPGFVYAGTVAYSASTLVSLYKQGYACVVAVKGYGHYVAVKSANSTDSIEIMDPGAANTSLSYYSSVNAIIYFTAKSSAHTHSYTEYNYEAAHPHKYYKKCSCGDYYYTGETKTLESCSECNPTGTVTYAVTGGNIYFDKSTGTITDCDTSVTAANIPSKIGGVAVKSIGWQAFFGCASLTSITIPSSVTSIGDCAFYGCTGLKSIDIPSSVTSLGKSAFSDCTGLTNITIPDSVKSIGGLAFSDCTSLTSITLPNSVTSIGSYAFYGCTGLTSVTIPNSITSIEGTFYGCTGLKSVTIPSNITSIGEDAFYGCTGLTGITIPDSVTIIGDAAFYGCTGLLSVTIPNSVTLIDWGAFKECASLTSITIPSSVTSIGDCAFYGCTGLKSIDIPSSVTSLGKSVFYSCTSLTSITIPNSVTSIGDKAFYQCSGLTNATISNGVTSIGNEAFRSCKNLKSVTLPNSVTELGDAVFRNCIRLTTVTIPEGLTSIPEYTFYYCQNITSITVPSKVTSIGSNAFKYCKSLTSITIPNSVTSIGNYAFRSCTSLTDVYYLGSAEQWNAISIGSDNDPLTSATIHYNYHTHDYTGVVTAPTCTEKGYTTYTCSVCKDTYTGNSVSALGHNYVNGVCTRCSATDPDYHTHNYTAAVTAPTCTAKGYTTYTCACGNSYVGSYTDALGHSYTNGVCDRCGAAEPKSEDGSIIVSTAKARAGSNVTVDISLKDNPGVSAITLAIAYDTDKLELVSSEDGGLTGWFVAKKAVWTSSGADSSYNGVILSLTFKVKEGVEDGTIPVTVSYSSGDIGNNDEESLFPSIVAGGVTVFSVIPGDINGDGNVNSLDLIRLKKYIADDTTELVGSGDVNGDGNVNSLDLIRLKKYIAGSDVELF